MKRLSLIFLLAAFIGLAAPQRAAAQYVGSTSQLTTSQRFSESYTAGQTTRYNVDIRNVAQAAHQVTLEWTSGFADQAPIVYLEGSVDDTNWLVLGSTPGGEMNVPRSMSANGYYPFLRLAINVFSVALVHDSSVAISYAGYQNPIQIPAYGDPVPAFSASTYTQMVGSLEAGFSASPQVLLSLACENPGGAAAYIEVAASGITPTLGSATVLFEAPIAASGFFQYSGPPLEASVSFWVGAATTAGGATPAATPLRCTASVNSVGPFGPFIPPE